MSFANEEVTMDFATKVLGSKPDYLAPDGSEVRLLLKLSRGEMAHFALRSRGVSKAVVHASIEEIWYFVAGRGRMWRRKTGAADGEVVDVFPGVSIAIPPHTQFQFRNDADVTLEAVGTTMPCWPGPDEATLVDGIWDPTAP
jgi:mannose-6-phosphate isomerase-like protein (cupin superfamily)